MHHSGRGVDHGGGYVCVGIALQIYICFSLLFPVHGLCPFSSFELLEPLHNIDDIHMEL